MEKTYWSSADLHNLFLLEEKISRQTLLNSEERGEIPKAKRIARGKVLVRQWTLEQIPEIGARFGFLKKPKSQQIICVYTPKGGVLKTSFGFNFGRMLALNGNKTLIIGLDIQGSITNYTIPRPKFESLEEYSKYMEKKRKRLGLYHYLYDKASISKVIQKTSLPTLDIIPETPDLNVLEKKLRLEARREYLFKDKLLNDLSDYDVIIFDNGPGWNQLVECALTASKHIASPIGCDIETFEALETNLNIVFEFQEVMKLEWSTFYLVPTLLEKTNLSQQIYGVYVSKYGNKVLPIPIRRSVKGQEARVVYKSVVEFEPKSPLAQDYHELTRALWSKIIEEKTHGA